MKVARYHVLNAQYFWILFCFDKLFFPNATLFVQFDKSSFINNFIIPIKIF